MGVLTTLGASGIKSVGPGEQGTMASTMKAYTTQKALKTVVENFRKPRQLFMYHPIQFEINGTFPTTKTALFSKNVNGTTYWLANMTNEYERFVEYPGTRGYGCPDDLESGFPRVR